ncbi:MAG: hypothetical protein KDI61_12655 [Alphaproteobacteria bacterium]|nr:hypothetical protein [Alphaproteobacteria bacterium]
MVVSIVKRTRRVLLGVFLFLALYFLSMCATKYYDLRLSLSVIAREFFGEKDFRIESQAIDVIGIANYGHWHIVLSDNLNIALIEKRLFDVGFHPITEKKGLKCYYNGELLLRRGSCPFDGPPCWVTICFKDGDKNIFIDITAE